MPSGNGRLLRSHLSFGEAHRDLTAQGPRPLSRQPLPPVRPGARGGSGLPIRRASNRLVLRVPRVGLLGGEIVRRVIEGKRAPLCVCREVEPQVARVAQAGGESTEVPERR